MLHEVKKYSENDDAQRIACFSKKAVSATMMGHYGNNEGVIIAYDVDELENLLGHDALLAVIYSNDPYAFPLEKINDPFSPNLHREIHVGTSGRKYVDWTYEQEVRLVVKDTKAIESTSHQLTLLPNSIAGICMVPNINTQFKNVLIHVCDKRNIPIFKVVKNDKSYLLSTKRVNLTDCLNNK